MSEESVVPRYMEQLLEELGWNKGSRIPLASAENKVTEDLLVSRQHEIQRLKEALAVQTQKQKDLDKYKLDIKTEYQENTRLLFALKSQLEQEVKLRQMAVSETQRVERDTHDYSKQNQEICERLDRFQRQVARLLKRADNLKTEVCGERGAITEWRAAIERSAGDITSIEQFTKQDLSKAKEMEYKRQLLKVEHDRLHEHLHQLVCNLAAEERACERISFQVMEGLDQRKQMMSMWSSAVEVLRQRDTDIKHIREDYAVLEAEAKVLTDQCREQQTFFEQQRGNNVEAQRVNTSMLMRLSQVRMATERQYDDNLTMESETKSLHRVLENVQHKLEKLRTENKEIMEEQRRRERQIKLYDEKIIVLKAKMEESMDKTKSAENRSKELEEMLNEEERYTTALAQSKQRAMRCSYVEEQKLVVLKNEEKLFIMQLRAAKAIMGKFKGKQDSLEKQLQVQKETLYKICYQVETVGAKVLFLEGAQAARDCDAELVVKENRLKQVLARHTGRVNLLERHSAKLHDDMHRLAREIEVKRVKHDELKTQIKTSLLNVAGCQKDYKQCRAQWRRERVEEALTRLRVAHAVRAVAGFDDTAFTINAQRLHLDAAMNERMVEIGARRDMFTVQKRALLEDCGKLRCEVREREQRITQLIKRYDIFINSLGKDDSGQQVSVTYFKIKFAAERAELRLRGQQLDAEITRREKDVSALEATLRVIAAAHTHFIHHIQPLGDDTAEMTEIQNLLKEFYAKTDEVKLLRANIAEWEERVNDATSRLQMITDKNKQLTAREAEAEVELENARDRMSRQETRLSNAKDIVRHFTGRAKKLVGGIDDWRIFQMALWVRDYAEAASNALHALFEICANAPEVKAHFASLVSSTDIRRHVPSNQRRLLTFIERLVADGTCPKQTAVETDGTVFSSSSASVCSGVSQASGYTRRLAAFRKTLAHKVQEPMLAEQLSEVARRSTVSLRVVTLGIETSMPSTASVAVIKSRRSLK